MKSTSERYIRATEESVEQLARLFNCMAKYVYMCLTYRQENETARKIRYTAVKHYGATPMIHVPECETIHDMTEGGREVMRQVFSNGVTLRVDKNTGEAWATDRKGAEVLRGQVVKFTDLMKIQAEAENL